MRVLRDLLGGASPYDVAIRTSRTFLQTLGSALIVGGILDLDLATLEAAGLAAGAAGIAVVMGYLRPHPEDA